MILHLTFSTQLCFLFFDRDLANFREGDMWSQAPWENSIWVLSVWHCSLLREVDAWQEMTVSTVCSRMQTRRKWFHCFLPSTSWIWLRGLMTPTLGFDLKPGISQRLSKVIIHWTCDGHRVGHGLRFFVVFPKAAAEVLLNHRIAHCVSWNYILCGKNRPKFWLLPSMLFRKKTTASNQ